MAEMLATPLFVTPPRRPRARARGGAAAAAAEVTRLRIGEGFPVDNPKAWSSPLWVVRVLKDGPPKF